MTVVFGSLDVGSAVGLVVCGPLIAAAGWPAVFYLFAALGLLWCTAWPLLKPESKDTTVEQPAAAPNAKPAGAVPDEAQQRCLAMAPMELRWVCFCVLWPPNSRPKTEA